MRPIKKAVYLLNINDYEPEICARTYPLIEHYASRCGAEVYKITERKFPDWPVVYEKLQIYTLAREHGNDWNIYIDSDALIHPDAPDFTTMINKDTVMHFGCDFAPIRWVYDEYFLRDGRFIGSGNWFTIASDWCLDLWRPLDDLTYEEAVANIRPTVKEEASGLIEPGHLIDDYVLSRNIARFGLKFLGIRDLVDQLDKPFIKGFFNHNYTKDPEGKVYEMDQVLESWGVSVP